MLTGRATEAEARSTNRPGPCRTGNLPQVRALETKLEWDALLSQRPCGYWTGTNISRLHHRFGICIIRFMEGMKYRIGMLMLAKYFPDTR